MWGRQQTAPDHLMDPFCKNIQAQQDVIAAAFKKEKKIIFLKESASFAQVCHCFSSYFYMVLLTTTPISFNRGKMSQNGQEPVKQLGVGVTDSEGKKKYKQLYTGTPCLQEECAYFFDLSCYEKLVYVLLVLQIKILTFIFSRGHLHRTPM